MEYNIITHTDNEEEIQYIIISSSNSSIQININLKLKNVVFIHSLIVNKQYQNKGLGKDILNYAINYCKNNLYCDTITCDCLINSWMIEWYKRLGFRPIDIIRNNQYVFMVLFI